LESGEEAVIARGGAAEAGFCFQVP
jgi:hypothetical protein